jgi:hypothetical protein
MTNKQRIDTVAARLSEAADLALQTYARQQTVVDAIRTGYAKVKHHVKWTTRIHQAIREALAAAFPEDADRLVVSGGGYSEFNLLVWGVGGITYDHRLSLSFHSRFDGEAQTWQAGFERELDRQDVRDCIEDLGHKASAIPALAVIEADLQAAVEAAKDRYAALAARFEQVPKAATLRADSCHWSGFPSALTEGLHAFKQVK